MVKQLILALCFLSPAWATIAVVQSKIDSSQVSCSAGACGAMAVTTTGSGHAGVFAITSSVAGNSISSITCAGATCSGWQVSHSSPACQGTDATGVAATDIAYYPALPSGITSITVTLTSTTTDGNVDRGFVELSYTGSSMAFDVCGNRTNTPASANYNGVTLSLTGSNDFILQVGRPATAMTACTGWTTPATFVAGDGYCGKLNTASGTAVAWTATSSTAALSALAMKEVSGAAVCNNHMALMGEGCK